MKCVKSVMLSILANKYLIFPFEYEICMFIINPCTVSIKYNNICGEMAHCHSTMS